MLADSQPKAARSLAPHPKAPRVQTHPRCQLMPILGCVVAMLALLSPRPAHGAGQSAESDRLFRSGVEAMARGDLAVGCPLLQQSYKLDPLPGGLFTLADCEEAAGRIATASRLYDEFIQRYPQLPPELQRKHAERYQVVLTKLAALSQMIPQITLVVPSGAPRDMEVRFGDRLIPPNQWGVALPIDPARHTVTATIPGRPPWTSQVLLERGQRIRLEVSVPRAILGTESQGAGLLPSPGPRVGQVPVHGRTPAPAAPVSPWLWASGGLTVAALGVGAVYGGIALDRGATVGSHCSQHQCDPTGLEALRQGKESSMVANISFATAGAAGAMSLLLLWPVLVPATPTSTADRGSAYSTGQRTPRMTLGVGPSGVLVGGSF